MLAAGLAFPVLALAGKAGAQGTTARFRALGADVSPLDAFGGGGARNLLQPALLAEMHGVFGDLLDPGDRSAPVLTARITRFYFSIYDGEQRLDNFGGEDSIEGDGIVSAGGRVVSSTHLLTSLPPSYSGSLVTPGLDRIRYQSIAHQFVWWLRREMGL